MPKRNNISLDDGDELSTDQDEVVTYISSGDDCDLLHEGTLFRKHGKENLTKLLGGLSSCKLSFGMTLAHVAAARGKVKMLAALKACGHDLQLPD